MPLNSGPKGGPVSCKVKFALVIVNGSIASLKVALTVLLRQTPVDRSSGFTDVTVGGIVSGAAAVVNVHIYLLAAGNTA